MASVPCAVLSDACANNPSRCEAPSSGTFSLSLTYSQTLPVSVYCAAPTQATTCTPPAPSWTGIVSVDGPGASLESSDGGGGSTWTCEAVSPESSSDGIPDGGVPGTACYLLVTCNQGAPGGIGPVQIQIFAQASPTDVLALVQDSSGDCCVNEYTGTWNQVD
jgi:hypothetical protein